MLISNIKRVLVLLMLFFSLQVFTACGYKPSSYYAKQEIKGSVFVDFEISLEDSKNSVLVKDAFDEILVNKFDVNFVAKKELADTIVKLKIDSVNLEELQYDKDGYIKLYRATTNILVSYKSDREYFQKVVVSGSYDFSIDDGKEITEAKRFDAIKKSATKALEEFVSKVAVNNFRK